MEISNIKPTIPEPSQFENHVKDLLENESSRIFKNVQEVKEVNGEWLPTGNTVTVRLTIPNSKMLAIQLIKEGMTDPKKIEKYL